MARRDVDKAGSCLEIQQRPALSKMELTRKQRYPTSPVDHETGQKRQSSTGLSVNFGRFKNTTNRSFNDREKEQCESGGGRSGLPFLISLTVSVDVDQPSFSERIFFLRISSFCRLSALKGMRLHLTHKSATATVLLSTYGGPSLLS